MIGERFREHRKALGMTQAEMAERLFVSQPMVAQVEAGQCHLVRCVSRSVKENLSWQNFTFFKFGNIHLQKNFLNSLFGVVHIGGLFREGGILP